MALWRNIILSLVATICVVGWGRAQQSDYARYANFLNEQDKLNRCMEMGVSVGASFLNTTPSVDVVSLSPKVGVRAALEMSLVWEKKYALQMEVGYQSNKADVELGARKLKLRSNIVEVPLIFSYRGLRPVRLGVGVVLSPIASGRYDAEAERLEFGQLRQTVGYVADVGVRLTQHLLLDARFVGGFGEVANYFEGAEFTSRSWSIGISVGYMF